jgi:hypothetical protein
MSASEASESSVSNKISLTAAELEAIIERDREQQKQAAWTRLAAKRAANPKEYSDRMLKRYHENKEAINARRREIYAAKKAAASTSIPVAFNSDLNETNV